VSWRAKFIDAAIPFLGGVIALLIGFRILGKKPGADPKYDEWHAPFGNVLKVAGVVLIVVAFVYLALGSGGGRR